MTDRLRRKGVLVEEKEEAQIDSRTIVKCTRYLHTPCLCKETVKTKRRTKGGGEVLCNVNAACGANNLVYLLSFINKHPIKHAPWPIAIKPISQARSLRDLLLGGGGGGGPLQLSSTRLLQHSLFAFAQLNNSATCSLVVVVVGG